MNKQKVFYVSQVRRNHDDSCSHRHPTVEKAKACGERRTAAAKKAGWSGHGSVFVASGSCV